VAEHLGIRENDPVLILSGVTHLADGRPIEHFIGIHRGDRSRFEVELYRPLSHEGDSLVPAMVPETAGSPSPVLLERP
jgi:GntR family transcriptional regulator